MKHRGFALPLVVLLVFVGALAVSLMLERHSIQRLAVMRHRDAYVMHHASAGAREMFNRWLSLAHGGMTESIDADGRCFRLELPGDEYIDFYAQDWQGRALINPGTVAGDQRRMAASMRDDMATLPPDEQARVTRQLGPIELSIATASPQAIHALCRAVISDPDKARKAAENLVAIVEAAEREGRRGSRDRAGDRADSTPRASGNRAMGISAADSGQAVDRSQADDLTDALRSANVPDDEREELMSYLTFTPVLWRVVAQKVDSQGRVLQRSGGLAIVDSSVSEGFNQGGPFLTWEQLSTDSPDWVDSTNDGMASRR